MDTQQNPSSSQTSETLATTGGSLMPEHSDYIGMTDAEFNEQVLKPVLAEARRRRFTVRLDPFGLLSPQPRERRPIAFQYPGWPKGRAF